MRKKIENVISCFFYMRTRMKTCRRRQKKTKYDDNKIVFKTLNKFINFHEYFVNNIETTISRDIKFKIYIDCIENKNSNDRNIVRNIVSKRIDYFFKINDIYTKSSTLTLKTIVISIIITKTIKKIIISKSRIIS